VNVLYELKLDFAVAIRSNHAVWLPRKQTVRHNRWRKFERVFSDGKTERYIREIILVSAQQFWELTTDPEKESNVVCNDAYSSNIIKLATYMVCVTG